MFLKGPWFSCFYLSRQGNEFVNRRAAHAKPLSLGSSHYSSTNPFLCLVASLCKATRHWWCKLYSIPHKKHNSKAIDSFAMRMEKITPKAALLSPVGRNWDKRLHTLGKGREELYWLALASDYSISRKKHSSKLTHSLICNQDGENHPKSCSVVSCGMTLRQKATNNR